MEYVQFGNTGLKVSRLGFGIMTFETTEQAIELLQTARNYGCNFFDGAEVYGSPRGNAEKLFGLAYQTLKEKDPLKWRRSDLVITTKIFLGPNGSNKPNNWSSPDFGENEVGVSRKHLLEGVRGALERLKLDYVDVIYAHRNDPVTPLLETVRTFTQIIEKGKAFYWGTSMWPVERIIEAYWIAQKHNLIPPVVEQCKYSMLERKYLESVYVPLFNNRYKYATTIWGALDAGILTGKYLDATPKSGRYVKGDKFQSFYGDIPSEKNEKVRELKMFIDEEGLKCSLTNLSLAWALKNSNVTVIILGARNAKQLDSFECMDVVKQLTGDRMEKIDKLLNNKPVMDPLLYQALGFRAKRTFKERSKL